MDIDGKTELVGIVGHPIDYSLSPAIHNAAFRSLGMNWVYVPLRVPQGMVEPALRGLRALGFKGANVTNPYKMEAARFLDELREEAGLLGAVNTVVNEGGRLIGYNTDVKGFQAFLGEIGLSIAGMSVLLIGAGGASRAVALAVAREGAARIYIMNRTRQKALAEAELLKSANPATEISVREFDHIGSRVLGECEVVVNCTPLAAADGHELPLDYGDFAPGKWAVDLKYAGLGMAFLREASARGARIADGEGMLLHQAAASFRLWTGETPPLERMREAYRRAAAVD